VSPLNGKALDGQGTFPPPKLSVRPMAPKIAPALLVVAILGITTIVVACRLGGRSVTSGKGSSLGQPPDSGEIQIMKLARRQDGRFDLEYCRNRYWTVESIRDPANATLRTECDKKCWLPLGDFRRLQKSCQEHADCASTKSNALIVNQVDLNEAQDLEDRLLRSGCPLQTFPGRLEVGCFKGKCVMERGYGR